MTTRSMTGFARTEGAWKDWTWSVEARSVNGRNLEVRFRGPPGLDALERVGRDAAQARFQRGQLNIAVQAKRSIPSRRTRVNAEILERYLSFGATVVAEGRATTPSLDGLLALPGVIEIAEEDDDPAERVELEGAVAAAIVGTLDALDQARRAEGASLAAVLSSLMRGIERLTAQAEAAAAEQPALIRARFARRLTELVGEAADEGRILQEAAAMATRADVREELDRLKSHVAAADALLGQDGASGRRLDFLTQEFMREANTLCSKSASAALTTIGLELKALIDQFREQVQNVE